MRQAVYWLAVLGYLAGCYLLVSWVLFSIAFNDRGVIRWDKGWQAVKDAYCPD